MDISFWRDLVIVVLGLITTVGIVFISVIVFKFYKQTITLMDSANEVIGKVNNIIDYTEQEVMQPIMQFGTVVQGIIQGVNYFTGLFKKREDSDE